MYWFLLRPKWIGFHLLVIFGVVLMIWLGFWQLDRLDQRKAFNEAVVERSDEPPVSLTDLLSEPDFDPATAEWRRVTVEGTWLPGQVIVFNRTQNGQPGDNIVTPLLLDGHDGQDSLTVLINRGFVPVGVDDPGPPEIGVEVLARVRPSQERQRGGLTDATDGPVTEIRRVDIPQLALQMDGNVAPVYLDLIASIPEAGPSAPIPVPAPTVDDGPHLSYAMQWFIFALAVMVGWTLAVRRSSATRRAS
jgi:cytochrome oxidase assembly protein ShyY1